MRCLHCGANAHESRFCPRVFFDIEGVTKSLRESHLYQRIEPKLNQWGAATRIENALAGSLPDIIYCIKGTVGFIETKLEKGGQLYFEKFQIPWAIRQLKAGCRHLFVVAMPDYDDTTLLVYDYENIVATPRFMRGKWKV